MELSQIELNGFLTRLIESQGADDESRDVIAKYVHENLTPVPKKIRIKINWDDGPDYITGQTAQLGTVTQKNPDSFEARIKSNAEKSTKQIGQYVLHRVEGEGVLIWKPIRGVKQGISTKINLLPPHILGIDNQGKATFFGIPSEVDADQSSLKDDFWLHDDGSGHIQQESVGIPTIQEIPESEYKGVVERSKRVWSKVVHPAKKQYSFAFRLTWGTFPYPTIDYKGEKYATWGHCTVAPPSLLNKGWTIEY